MSQVLESVVVETGESPDRCVIWLHGLGADGHDFEPVVPELRLDSDLSVRFIFPHAPIRPVTLNNGMAMRAWYDIRSLDKDGRLDEQGIRESQLSVEALIKQQNDAGIATKHIVLAGFSQGAALALHTGLRYADKLSGIMALSGYLPSVNSLEEELSIANRDTPIFMAHGTVDPVVNVDLGRESCAQLQAINLPVQWFEYPMAHQVCMEELQEIGQWLSRVLAA